MKVKAINVWRWVQSFRHNTGFGQSHRHWSSLPKTINKCAVMARLLWSTLGVRFLRHGVYIQFATYWWSMAARLTQTSPCQLYRRRYIYSVDMTIYDSTSSCRRCLLLEPDSFQHIWSPTTKPRTLTVWTFFYINTSPVAVSAVNRPFHFNGVFSYIKYKTLLVLSNM